jgi:hydroxyacylglutathione hydrolase
MQINEYVGRFFHAKCYILTFEKMAIVIDPCISYQQIKKEIGSLPLKAVLLTHGHADHFCYLNDIEQKEKVKIYCHKNAKEKIEDENKNYSVLAGTPIKYFFPEDDYVFLHEGQTTIEGIPVKVLETPGHSNCSLCFIIEEELFTGDTLFYQTVGRTDLYTSNTWKLRESLKKLAHLTVDYHVYPGHGKSTLLSYERTHNQYLQNLN